MARGLPIEKFDFCAKVGILMLKAPFNNKSCNLSQGNAFCESMCDNNGNFSVIDNFCEEF